MGSIYDAITPEQAELIEASQVFFVASVASDLSDGTDGQGAVNVSPKGGVPLHIIDDHHVAYLDYLGSGNETGRHAATGGPITVMVMAMEGENAAVVRLYGHATVTPIGESPLAERLLEFQAESIELPMRQVIEIEVHTTGTSCGYGVPVFEFKEQRVRSQRGRAYKAR